MSSPYLTARDLVTRAMVLNGSCAEGEVPLANEMARGFLMMNSMIDGWNLQPLTTLVNTRDVFDITADTASYTFGPSGTWVITGDRPSQITDAYLLLNTADPPVEIPMALLTSTQYNAIAIKDLSSTQPTSVYFQPTNPNGTVTLWPVPSITTNQLVLYWDAVFPQFSSVNASVQLPPGYDLAIVFNLAILLGLGWRAMDPEIRRLAKQFLDQVKASNLRLNDLDIDPGLAPSGGGYNILSDTYRSQ